MMSVSHNKIIESHSNILGTIHKFVLTSTNINSLKLIQHYYVALSVSNIEDIPEPFAHRLEGIEMPGYIERAKILVAKKHILPKLYKRHGLLRTEIKISDKVLSKIIRQYTMEAGLIGFQQQLEKIFRRTARKKATGESYKVNLTESTIDKFLGTPQFIPEKAMSKPEVGVANGTWINNVRLVPGQPMTVSDGAHVKFGHVELTFQAKA